MPPKPRQVKVEHRSALSAMSRLETKTNEELESETKYRSAAQAILGARAAERMDPKTAREHFRQAIAAARPQERVQLRRMAELALAQAERRPDDFNRVAEKLGQQKLTGRQLFAMRFIGMIVPPPGSPIHRKVLGILFLLLIVVLLLAIGWALAKLIFLPFGGVGSDIAVFWGFVIVVLALGTLAVFGRRRQKKALAARQAAAGR